jgi:two-component system, sensor histidine kinase and response regulator
MERILIAEDSPTQREMLRHMLAGQGYEVTTAVDGRDAWAQVGQLAPTMVVTDILMPGMDGYALCRAIKNESRFAAIPVILLTSLSNPRDVIAALECGADSFIGKPFEEDYLLARIKSVIVNRDLPERGTPERGVKISHDGRTHVITAEPTQVLDLLLSVYDVAMRRNEDLAQAQAGMRKLNAELEQKVRDRTRKFEESNSALETFCYSVAHDLRAPLRSIQGYVSILNDDYAANLDASAREYAARACAAAGRMDTLILDLLAYGRVSHAEAAMERVDVRAEIERVLAEFSIDIAAAGADVEVAVEETVICSSRVLVGQILTNLVSNALKFVRPGEPAHVRITAGYAADMMLLTVTDQGIGIDLNYRDKMFNVFEKLHNEPFTGTGIGLAIVRKAAERLGGQVTVESEYGKGSCFTVVIPRGAPV